MSRLCGKNIKNESVRGGEQRSSQEYFTLRLIVS